MGPGPRLGQVDAQLRRPLLLLKHLNLSRTPLGRLDLAEGCTEQNSIENHMNLAKSV